jgi:ABC-type uncharacterized transport system, permease component
MLPSSILAIILYLVAASLFAWRLCRAVSVSKTSRNTGIAVGLLATAVHAGILYRKIFTEAGLNLGFYNAMSLVGWLIAVMLLLTSLRRPVENLGIALLPLAALSLGLETTLYSDPIFLQHSPWPLQAHIVLSIMAFSLLNIAAAQALVLATQEHHLRNKHLGGWIRALPPLQTMEALLFQMIGVGFVLLSLSILSGMIFLENIFAQHLVHKTVFALTAWVVFAVLLWGRWRFGWRGRTAIRWTLGGFVSLLLAYFGTKLVLELILHRIG